MTSARFIVGDVFDTLATIPDGSIDLVLTSPPFLALRSYLPADHPMKGKEIGSEPTPGAFIDTLDALTEEWARVLAPHGSIAIELGDTYSGSGGAGGDYNDGGLREGQNAFDGSARRSRTRQDCGRYAGGYSGGTKGHDVDGSNGAFDLRPANGGDGWPDAKSMCLIPELYRISLVYGFNPLTGRHTPRWRARNVVRWCRPNPPVGALADKFRPATSDMVIACKAKDRYFDLDAVRVPFTGHEGVGTGVRKGQNGDKPTDNRPDDLPTRFNTHDGAPPLDWWRISTQPYKGAHYATWPDDLCVRPIESMCPRRVCRTCGKPSERITSTEQVPTRSTNGRKAYPERGSQCENFDQRTEARVSTLGWSDCGHENWRNGVVLDPFAGSGTTLAVATGHGREAIGIDLDERNADLASQRVGMFLTVEHLEASDVA